MTTPAQKRRRKDLWRETRGSKPGSRRLNHVSNAETLRSSCLNCPNHTVSFRVEPHIAQTEFLTSLYGINGPTSPSRRISPATMAEIQSIRFLVREVIV